MTTVRASERLILALDVATVEDAERLLGRVGDDVPIVKVGLELFAQAGPRLVHRLREAGRRVFLDLKFLDIGETVRRATRQVADLGVEFLTVHADRQALEAAVKAREESRSGMKILAVTVLTSTGTQDLQEVGIQMAVPDLVALRARFASELGCDGVVASGEEPQVIRRQVGESLVIVTPGIRAEPGRRDDHARVSTPASAIAAGSDYLVVGRPIRDAPDPRAAAQAIIREMQAAFDARKEGYAKGEK